MLEMIELFVRYLEKGDPWIAILVAVPLTVAIFRLLYNLIFEIKERKNNDLKGALQIEGLSDDVRCIIQESLNRTYFYRATGIASDHYIRSKIRLFLETTRGDISLRTLWRTSEYIDVENGKLIIKIKRFDVVDYYYQIFSGVLLSLVCIFGYVLLLLTWGTEDEGKPLLLVVSTLGFAFSLHSAWKVITFHIAKTVLKPAFEKFENVTKSEESEGPVIFKEGNC